MQIHVARSIADLEDAAEMATGETWGRARDFLKRVGKDPFADHLRWFEEDGRPVACVQVFLHGYSHHTRGEGRQGDGIFCGFCWNKHAVRASKQKA